MYVYGVSAVVVWLNDPIQAGAPVIVAASSDLFTPHETRHHCSETQAKQDVGRPGIVRRQKEMV